MGRLCEDLGASRWLGADRLRCRGAARRRGVVVEVYSNSSSAPNSASSTFYRSPSLRASASPAPTSANEQAATPALLALGLLAQGVGRALQRAGRLLQLLLDLLVLQRLRGALPVHAAVGLARRLEGRAQVVAQVGVLDELLHVRVVLAALPAATAPAPAFAAFFFAAIALLSSACLHGPYPGLAPGTPDRADDLLARSAARGLALRAPALGPAVGLESRLSTSSTSPRRYSMLLEQVRREIVDVGLVAPRRDHAGDLGALGGQRLLLSPPIGSTWPVSVISPVMAVSDAHRAPADQRGQRGGHRDPRARAVLGDRARGHVHVHVVLPEPVLGHLARRAWPRCASRRRAPPAPTPSSRRPAGP